LKRGELKDLREGEVVEFEIINGSHGPVATNIKVVRSDKRKP
jgi:cold shock CspA family protein